MKEAMMVAKIAICTGIACAGVVGLCAGSVSELSHVGKEAGLGEVGGDAGHRAEVLHALERAGAPIAKLDTADLGWGMSEMDRIFTDVGPDGVLWVRGRDYKASFDADGLTFVPFFGSDAPQNYPVSFRFESLSVDGQTFAVGAPADDAMDPDFDEAAVEVRYERGFGDGFAPVVEVYSLAISGVEQKFIFVERPQLAAAGHDAEPGLSLFIAFDSELSAIETPDALRFSNELGHVEYTHAVLIDAAGRHTPLLTWLDAESDRIVIDIPAEVLDAQVFPVVVDPVITTFTISQTANPTLNPDVAYDMTTDRYIVVAERPFSATDGDIWSELRTSTGALVAGSGAWVDVSVDDWRRARVANNRIASQFLVVAQVGTEAPRNIWGRTRLATGTMGLKFAIAESGFDKINPDVGGDPHPDPPTRYLVVWQRVFSSTDHDIHGAMVTSGGTVGSLILIDNLAANHDRFPSISKTNGNPPFSTQEWTVVWQRSAGLFNEDIWGAQIHWNGTVTHPSFPISVSGSLDVRPAVSSLLDSPPGGGPRRYMVTFQRGFLVPRTVQGRVMQGNTLVTSANLTALQGQGVGQDHFDSHVDSDGKTFIVAFSELWSDSSTDWDVYVASFCLNGDTLVCSEAYRNLAFTIRPERQVRVAASRGGATSSNRSMVVWTRQEEGADPNLVRGGIYQSVSCCVGDLTGNGNVGVPDLLALLACWGPVTPSCTAADLTGNNNVGVPDLLALLANWGPCP